MTLRNRVSDLVTALGAVTSDLSSLEQDKFVFVDAEEKALDFQSSPYSFSGFLQ